MNRELVAVAIPAPLHKTFDYWVPSDAPPLRAGMRVRVPFGRRLVTGVVAQPPRVETLPEDRCKSVEAVLDDAPLIPAELFSLLQWCSRYYQHPLGEICAAAMPGPLRQGKEVVIKPAKKSTAMFEPQAALPLTAEQQAAYDALAAGEGFRASLLQGVTGSGKTELYLRLTADALARGEQALILTPEIGLTPQLMERFVQRFGAQVVSFHSGMTDVQRTQTWLRARAGEAGVVIGTRSALFVPFARLGLIVLDEEHDPSYKQQEGFRYSARDVALVRAQRLKIPVVLGTATPSLETLHNAQGGRYQHLRLQQRVQSAAPPRVSLLDVRSQPLTHGLSRPLLDRIQHHVDTGGQALLFINRRGYAPMLLCHDCGWSAPCQSCDARMTVHRSRGQLICHHCGAQQPLVKVCPSCESSQLMALGQGTERIEDALRNHFPRHRVERLDSDRARKAGEMERLLADIQRGDIHILVGTQILAKGHDFAGLSLVGIVSADQALYGADFRAIERMGQLVTQVAGRAGRAKRAGEVILQTHEPDHPLMRLLVKSGYDGLCPALLKERENAGLPPCRHMAVLRAESTQAEVPLKFLQQARDLLEKSAAVEIGAPIPALMERRAGRVRAQMLLQSGQRPALQRLLAQALPLIEQLPLARKVRWSVDVDPYDLF